MKIGICFKLLFLLTLCIVSFSCKRDLLIENENPEENPIVLNGWEVYTGACDNTLTDNYLEIQKALRSSQWSKTITLKNARQNALGKFLIARIKLPEFKEYKNCLYIAEESQFVQVYLNHSLICELNNLHSSKLIRSGFLEYHLINLPQYKSGEYLILRVMIDPRNDNLISNVLYGSPIQIVKKTFRNSALNLFFSIAIVFCGLLLLIINLSVIHSRLIFGASSFLISMAVFIYSNLPVVHLFYNHPILYYQLDYISLMALSSCGFYVAEQITDNKYKKYIRWLFRGNLLFLFGSFSLINLNLAIYAQILPFFLLWLGFGMIIYLFILVLNSKNVGEESKFLLAGRVGFYFFVFLEIFCFFRYRTSYSFGYNVTFLHYGAIWLVFFILLIEEKKILKIKHQREVALQNAYEATKRENSFREQFEIKSIEYQEEEHKRIAIELHDSIGQNLIVIRNQLLKLVQKEKNQSNKNSLDSLSSLAGATIQEIRDISRDLCPRLLDQLGLNAAIESLIDVLKETTEIKFILSQEDVDIYICSEHKINIYRIVQESLTNVLKHSQATHVNIDIRKEDLLIHFYIEDNGTGLHHLKDVEYNGLGIFGMRRRTKMIGAQLSINLSPFGGTIIHLSYPVIKTK